MSRVTPQRSWIIVFFRIKLFSVFNVHSSSTTLHSGKEIEKFAAFYWAPVANDCISISWRTDTQLTWMSTGFSVGGKSGPNCPSLRLPRLHTHTECMHRGADTQVTLMNNTRTSILTDDAAIFHSISWTHWWYTWTHGLLSMKWGWKSLLLSGEKLSLSQHVKIWEDGANQYRKTTESVAVLGSN